MEKKSFLAIGIIAVIVCAAIFGGLYLSRNIGKSQKTVSRESAVSTLEKYVKSIEAEEVPAQRGIVEYTESDNTFQELPELNMDSIAVNESTSYYAEIFSSSEKTGSGSDGWLREMAEMFNKSGIEVDGKQASIRLRTVSSGKQIDYVASGKYVPDAISPSNDLFIKMLNEKGVDTVEISKSLVMNYAGLVVSNKAYSTLVEEIGNANVESLAQATAENKLTVGYTNPFTSAAGMNFLVTLLDSYSSGNILSSQAVQKFSEFQKNIPFVALTTGQMRSAASKGTFDAFVLEYQTYINDSALSKNYKFIPFGYEHNNPLMMVGSSEKKGILDAFAKYCMENGENLALKDGFNAKLDDYHTMSTDYSGSELIAAQSLYKENKDVNPVICVFVADVSGSMAGEPLNALKSSLVNSMQYINAENYIGLVSYSDDVYINLPIGEFNLDQQSYFKGAVESMEALGGTCTFDGICVAMDMINKKLQEIPDAKTMIFVLSDGESNGGYSLTQVRSIISGLRIPIYTIGYNASIEKLQEISDINEGACIDASTEDVTYQLKQLFNANM